MSEPVLFRAQLAVEGAAEFCWGRRVAEGEDYPEPTGEAPPDELYRAVRRAERPGRPRVIVHGWWTLSLWQSAVVAVLSRKDIRKAVLPRPDFLETARAVSQASGAGAYLATVPRRPRRRAPGRCCTDRAGRASSSR